MKKILCAAFLSIIISFPTLIHSMDECHEDDQKVPEQLLLRRRLLRAPRQTIRNLEDPSRKKAREEEKKQQSSIPAPEANATSEKKRVTRLEDPSSPK